MDYTRSKDGKTAYAIVKRPAASVTLACAVPDGATVTVVGEGKPLPAEKGPDGLKVFLPSVWANAELPFALKISR